MCVSICVSKFYLKTAVTILTKFCPLSVFGHKRTIGLDHIFEEIRLVHHFGSLKIRVKLVIPKKTAQSILIKSYIKPF